MNSTPHNAFIASVNNSSTRTHKRKRTTLKGLKLFWHSLWHISSYCYCCLRVAHIFYPFSYFIQTIEKLKMVLHFYWRLIQIFFMNINSNGKSTFAYKKLKYIIELSLIIKVQMDINSPSLLTFEQGKILEFDKILQ